MAGTKANILIVEDDGLIAFGLVDALLMAGYEVIGAVKTVGEALALASQERAHLAILDIRLPGGKDGIEGATLLRRSSDIPIIFLTG
jgi:two-component system, LytTR family, response regulator